MTDRADSCDSLLAQAARAIGGDSPRLDAELLLSHVTGWTRTSFRAWPERVPSSVAGSEFRALVDQRVAGAPIAHLLGQQEFWSLPLEVNASTLIPRPDTECLVEAALSLPLPEHAQVLDLGTGTGAIALALASERPGWAIKACDAFDDAVALAARNAARLDLKIDVLLSHWFDQLPSARYDLIISNPPYIAANDEHLGQGDLRFEPDTALVSGADGLDDIRHLVAAAPEWLCPGGLLMLEHGYEQAPQVRDLFRSSGFKNIETRQDYGQRDRLTMGYWRPEKPRPGSSLNAE